MKLFKIAQTTNDHPRVYDSAVVAAETEDAARGWHPCGRTLAEIEALGWTTRSWVRPGDVIVTYVGEAAPDLPEGIVLASFNAG